MKLTSVFCAAAMGAAIVMGASDAQAETLLYTVTGDYTATWVMDSSPKSFQFDAGTFGVADVAGSFSDSDDGVVTVFFFVPDLGGGLQIFDDSLNSVLLDASGAQLWNGTLTTPAMLTGTFALTEYQGGPGRYTLSVTVVPEPGAAALMLAGLGVLGAVAAARRAATAS